MDMKNRLKYIFTSIIILLSGICNAQVGIFVNNAKASLHVAPTSISANSAEGIIAPLLTRSQVISKDDKYTLDQAGALVYITSIDGIVTPKTNKINLIGYYFFDGNVWQNMDKTRYFYLPTFVLPTSTIGNNQTFDLYNEVYKKQFVETSTNQYTTSNALLTTILERPYASGDLDYVVTLYDRDVININSISSDGVINYNVINNTLGPSSFINVVLIVK